MAGLAALRGCLDIRRRKAGAGVLRSRQESPSLDTGDIGGRNRGTGAQRDPSGRPVRFKQPPNPGWRLLAAVYPFAAGAMAVNLFFLSLVGSWIGWPVLTPGWSVAGGMALGAPAAWTFARHLRRLMAQADGEGS